MKRTELENKAYEVIKSDMSYIGATDGEIWNKIKNASDEDLEMFIED